MVYASNIIVEHQAVLEYIDEKKSKYIQYGLFIEHTILIEPSGYKVVIEILV